MKKQRKSVEWGDPRGGVRAHGHLVLDATCSLKKVWPEDADIRLDISRAAQPDIQADARRLPFRDSTFSEVYCDPPHSLRSGGRVYHNPPNERVSKCYGRFGGWGNVGNWYAFLDAVNVEFARVLKPDGVLWFKVTSGGKGSSVVSRTDLSRLTNFDVRSDRKEPSHGFFANHNRKMGRAPSFIHYVEMARCS